VLALPNIKEHWLAYHPQSKPGVVARDLPVVWRIAVDEVDHETELMGIEVTRCFDVGNEQLCGG